MTLASNLRIGTLGSALEVSASDGRLVPATDLDVPELEPLLALVQKHGAVSFEVLDAFGDWQPVVLLAFDVAWSVFERSGERRGVATSTRGQHVMALACEDLCSDPATWGAAVAVGTGALRGERDAHGRRTWRGSDFRLAPHPMLSVHRAKDWAHAWTLGMAASLVIEFERSAEEIGQFIARAAPLPYERKSEHEFLEPSGYERAPKLVILDGKLLLCRSYFEPADATAAFDAGLVASLCAGALGPLRWSVSDDDYGQRLADGADADSLADYLRASDE